MQELAAIRDAGIVDGVIFVDDLCCFAPPIANPPTIAQGYPTMGALKDAILAINADYEFYVYGDIAIACLPSAGVTFSPLVHAMTESRLLPVPAQAEYTPVLEAERAIALYATASEKVALKDLVVEHADRAWSVYPFLWYGLVRLGEKQSDALAYLFAALNAGYKDLRMYWYCQNAIQQAPEDMLFVRELIQRDDPWLKSLKEIIDHSVQKK